MKQGRKPRNPWDHLVPCIRRLRLAGASCKVIAQELGYSPSYIQEICIRYDLKKQFKCKPAIAVLGTFGTMDGGEMRPEET